MLPDDTQPNIAQQSTNFSNSLQLALYMQINKTVMQQNNTNLSCSAHHSLTPAALATTELIKVFANVRITLYTLCISFVYMCDKLQSYKNASSTKYYERWMYCSLQIFCFLI